MQLGRLLTGDTSGQVFLWLPREGGWSVQRLDAASGINSNKTGRDKLNKQKQQSSSSSSSNNPTVEEVQWKPLEEAQGEIFAAASDDGSIK